MSAPIPETVPQEIADKIRSNQDWGSLVGFAKACGFTRSEVYSIFLYGKYEPLKRLSALALACKTTPDKIYEILCIHDVDARKLEFEKLHKKDGLESWLDVAKVSGVSDETLRRYLALARPPKTMATYDKIGKSLGITLQAFAKCVGQ